eukprot:Rhum_TRINITY_DN13397_c1_g1::Rhum_TRINITY_DN13397_c1_g1_i1::g.58922::m.58922
MLSQSLSARHALVSACSTDVRSNFSSRRCSLSTASGSVGGPAAAATKSSGRTALALRPPTRAGAPDVERALPYAVSDRNAAPSSSVGAAAVPVAAAGSSEPASDPAKDVDDRDRGGSPLRSLAGDGGHDVLMFEKSSAPVTFGPRAAAAVVVGAACACWSDTDADTDGGGCGARSASSIWLGRLLPGKAHRARTDAGSSSGDAAPSACADARVVIVVAAVAGADEEKGEEVVEEEKAAEEVEARKYVLQRTVPATHRSHSRSCWRCRSSASVTARACAKCSSSSADVARAPSHGASGTPRAASWREETADTPVCAVCALSLRHGCCGCCSRVVRASAACPLPLPLPL